MSAQASSTGTAASSPPRRVLLLIGGPGTGKTHFGAQLLARLNQQHGRLRMRGAAQNLLPFETTLLRLSQGLTAGHTPTGQYTEVLLPVVDAFANEIDLVWPDYGGEQVDKMLANRHIPSHWRVRLGSADAWIVFVRLQQSHIDQDLLSRPSALGAPLREEAAERLSRWSDQSRLIELLQMLLFVRGVGTLTRLRAPALTVLLSCWDEITGLQDDAKPAAVLRERMPMLSSFIEMNWGVGSLSVLGLSSLGKALRDDAGDSEYLDRGPESFGYVVLPTGVRMADLTFPIAELAARL